MSIQIRMFWFAVFSLGFGFWMGSLQAQPASVEAMQARLDKEIEALEQKRQERLDALRDPYMKALVRQAGEARSRGDTSTLSVLAEEAKRVQAGGPLQPDEPATEPPLKSLHDILSNQVEKIDEEYNRGLRGMIPNVAAYAEKKALELRRSGKSVEGENWETWGRGLQDRYLADLPPPPTPTPPPARPARPAPAGATRFWSRLQQGEKQTLVIYGTSLVTQRHTKLPSRLRKAINKELGEDLVRVKEKTNAGKYSKWGANNIQSQVVRANPDAVVMEFASNDAVDRFNQSVAEARKNWERMVDTLREELPECDVFLYITAPPWDRSSSGKKAHALRRPGVEKYFDMVREVAAKKGVYLVDTYHEFAKHKDAPKHSEYRRYIGDGHHPTGRGVGDIIIPMMLQTFQHGSSDTLGRPGLHQTSTRRGSL